MIKFYSSINHFYFFNSERNGLLQDEKLQMNIKINITTLLNDVQIVIKSKNL